MFPELDHAGNPLLLHHLLNCEKKTVVLQGGRRCFGPETLIITDRESKKIKDINPGDKVLSYNESLEINELSRVTAVHKSINTQKTIKIKLKHGQTIICTEDHEFYFRGGWVTIKKILSLLNGNMENSPRI